MLIGFVTQSQRVRQRSSNALRCVSSPTPLLTSSSKPFLLALFCKNMQQLLSLSSTCTLRTSGSAQEWAITRLRQCPLQWMYVANGDFSLIRAWIPTRWLDILGPHHIPDLSCPQLGCLGLLETLIFLQRCVFPLCVLVWWIAETLLWCHLQNQPTGHREPVVRSDLISHNTVEHGLFDILNNALEYDVFVTTSNSSFCVWGDLKVTHLICGASRWILRISLWFAIGLSKLETFPGLPDSLSFPLSPRRAMHCLPQYMTASNTHFRMVLLFLSTFAAFFVSNRVDTVDVGCSTTWVNISACCRDYWWYWVSSCSLHFSGLLCQAVNGWFTNLPSFLCFCRRSHRPCRMPHQTVHCIPSKDIPCSSLAVTFPAFWIPHVACMSACRRVD